MQKIYLSIIKKRDHLVFILAVSISFNLLLNNNSPNTLLVRAKFIDTFSFLSTPSMWLKTIIQLEEETQLLREKNMQLKLQSDDMLRSFEENKTLRALLDYKKDSNFNLLSARVLNMGLSSNLSSITLNVGKEDGIRINQPIIIPEGIIGKTIAVGKTNSIAQLITDVNFRISVRILPSGSVGVLRYLNDDICEIREIQKNANIELGNIVFSSGFSSIYPPNLPVGTVIEIQDEISSFQKIVKVRISSKIGSLLNVFVIRDNNNE